MGVFRVGRGVWMGRGSGVEVGELGECLEGELGMYVEVGKGSEWDHMP